MICQQLGFKSLWKRQQLRIRSPWNVNDSGSSRSGYVNYLTSDIGLTQKNPELMPLEPPSTQTFYTPSWIHANWEGKRSGSTSAPDRPRPCLANANSGDLLAHTKVDHKVVVSVDSATDIPVGNLKLCHEDWGQPMLLRIGALCAIENRFDGVCYTEGNPHEGGDLACLKRLDRTILVCHRVVRIDGVWRLDGASDHAPLPDE